VLVALAFRCADLPIKPLHSDEGVNGWFSLRLWWTGHYKYVPSDYHGPLLYYVNLVVFWILGATDFSLRFGTALAGSLAVLAVGLFRRTIGPVGVVVAAMLLAVMPMDVYYSRTVIHEIYLVLFTLVFVGTSTAWLARGGPGLAVAAGMALGAMFATKETAILSVACIGLAAATIWILSPFLQPGFAARGAYRARGEVLRTLADRWRELLAAGIACVVVLVVLFSSFFTHLEGVAGIITSYTSWAEYGITGRNQGKSPTYWLTFVPHVWPALLLGLPEAFRGAWRRERPTVFLAVWFGASFVVYSLIPYKTPWCGLNISLPLVLLAGLGGARALRACGTAPGRVVGAVTVGLVMLVVLGRASWVQNLQRYDDDRLPFVYVQTQREYMEMVDRMMEVDRLGNHGGQLKVVSIDAKNPMRWYLYTTGWVPDHFKYYRSYPTPDNESWQEWLEEADLFVCRGEHTARLQRELGPGYELSTHPLRPGYQVSLFVPLELASTTEIPNATEEDH